MGNSYERVCIVCGADAFLLFKEWFCRKCALGMTALVRENDGRSIEEITQAVYSFIEKEKYVKEHDGSQPGS